MSSGPSVERYITGQTCGPEGSASGAVQHGGVHRVTYLRVTDADTTLIESTVTRPGDGIMGRVVRCLQIHIHSARAGRRSEFTIRDAVFALLRHFTEEREGVWDVLEIKSMEASGVICLAAAEFAIAMDFGCDLSPGPDGDTEVRILAGGRRGDLARVIHSIPRAQHLAGSLVTSFYRLRTRAWLAISRTPTAGREIDMVLPLPIPRGRELQPPPPVRFEQVDAAAVLRHPRRYASYGTDVETRVARHDLCFAGRVGGRLVFRMWLCVDPGFISARSPRLGGFRRSGYVYDSHTVPDWRGRRIRGAALHWVARELAASLDYLVLSVRPTNLASIRAAAKAGFRPVQDHEVQPTPASGLVHGAAPP